MHATTTQLCDGLKNALEEGALLLDVRSPAECSQGVLPGAINVPLTEIGSVRDRIDFSKTLLIYCRSGQRSEMARRFITSMGHEDVWNIGGYDHFRHC